MSDRFWSQNFKSKIPEIQFVFMSFRSEMTQKLPSWNTLLSHHPSQVSKIFREEQETVFY